MSPTRDVRRLRTVGGARLLRRRGFPALDISATEAARRALLVVGSEEPGPTTTGPLPDRTRARYEGDIIGGADGEKWRDLDVVGRFEPRGADQEISNVVVRGGTPPSTERGLIHAVASTVKRLKIEHVLLEPTVPDYRWNGITGHDFTARHVRTRRTTDGLGIFNEHAPGGPLNVLVEWLWVESMTYWSEDGGIHTDGTHNDGIQIQGGDGLTVRGFRIDGYLDTTTGDQRFPTDAPSAAVRQALACVQINNNAGVGPTTNLRLEDGWLRGGDIGLNGGSDKLKGYDLGDFLRLRFDRGQRRTVGGVPYAMGFDADVTANAGEGTADAPRYIDDGSLVTVRRNG
jgi:hypothetical protein